MSTSKKLPSPRSKALPDPRVYLSVSLPYEVATQLNDLATLHETTRHNMARQAIAAGVAILAATATKEDTLAAPVTRKE